MDEMRVKYFSARMLDTLDMNQFFRCLFEEFGDCPISFVPMTSEERASASTNINGIEAINERFWAFRRADGDLVRRRDIEETIVRIGQK